MKSPHEFNAILIPGDSRGPARAPIACRRRATLVCALAAGLAASLSSAPAQTGPSSFRVEETTIAEIQSAILSHRVTTVQVVRLYLDRIKAYNGPGAGQPDGILKPVVFTAHAKGVNALITLNLRPAARKELGFDEHTARSMTDAADSDPNMPDALEVAAREDEEFARTGRLVGPLHGVVMAIKDQYDTFDMRTTAGADVAYANDRPPHDATFVARLRAAGAIILAKANLGEYAGGGERSSFGGLTVNPYDTERSPGGSSAGSGASVAANLVTCAIAEETTSSVRNPARYCNAVGLAPTQELVSRYGMMGMGINTRVGPITRTVDDTARILSVIAGYDPKDPLTAFAYGRVPSQPYESFTHATSLAGLRIGVVREYMVRKLFTKADEQSIEITEAAIAKLKELGATIVDPGPGGELFTKYIKASYPLLENSAYMKEHPELFSGEDRIKELVALAVDPSKVPDPLTIRDIGGGGGGGGGGRGAAAAGAAAGSGESRYYMNVYLAERGDAKVRDTADLITDAQFYSDDRFADRRMQRVSGDRPRDLDLAERMQRRFAVQEIVLQAFADLKLDAVVYPTGNIPAPKLGAPTEPTVNGRGVSWVFLGMQGFPAITVPGGFTTEVYDRVLDDPNAPRPAAGGYGGRGGAKTHLVGPVAARLPVGVDFLGSPFSEPTLLKIAAAYEQATHNRAQPPDFGPLP
jgi:Asp-tRNA(Asn)/Glu-tRNA(Gln) amidotransferase A subunit family amidase